MICPSLRKGRGTFFGYSSVDIFFCIIIENYAFSILTIMRIYLIINNVFFIVPVCMGQGCFFVRKFRKL